MDYKEIIKKEVERLKKEFSYGSSAEAKYRVEAYKELLDFINSLPEVPVSDDLEKEIKRYYVDWNEHPEYVQTARHFAQWQKKQSLTIEDIKKLDALLIQMWNKRGDNKYNEVLERFKAMEE